MHELLDAIGRRRSWSQLASGPCPEPATVFEGIRGIGFLKQAFFVFGDVLHFEQSRDVLPVPIQFLPFHLDGTQEINGARVVLGCGTLR